MHLSRKQSIYVAVTIFVLFIATSALLLETDKKIRAPQNASDSSESTTPVDTSTVELKDFTRKEVKDGKVLWQLHAEIGKMYPKDNKAELTKAEMTLFRQNAPIKVNADTIQATFDAGAIKEALLRDNVIMIQQDGSVLTTSQARYSVTEQKVIIPSALQIAGTNIEIKANAASVNLATNIAVLKGGVSTHIKGEKRGK